MQMRRYADLHLATGQPKFYSNSLAQNLIIAKIGMQTRPLLPNIVSNLQFQLTFKLAESADLP